MPLLFSLGQQGALRAIAGQLKNGERLFEHTLWKNQVVEQSWHLPKRSGRASTIGFLCG